MSSPNAVLILEPNLSRAWGRALLHVVDLGGTKIIPAVVSIAGFREGEPEEDPAVRMALDAALKSSGMQSVHTVANTLFPSSLYRLAKYDRHKLRELYLGSYERFIALEPHKNGRGMYFHRLVAYGNSQFDQLEFIIQQYRSRPGVRHSMFQATTFLPELDDTPAAQLAFPCLQQLSFVPTEGGLVVNAFYATQQLFEKAYGNYLGVCRLGDFMAKEMGLPLTRVNVFAGVLKLERIGKRDPALLPVIDEVRRAIAEVGKK